MNLFCKIVSISSTLLVFHCLFPCQLMGAPRVDLSLDKKKITPHKTFSCTLTISWEGDADQYLVDRPRLITPEDIIEKGSSSSSTTRGDNHLLQYRYDLQAQQEGNYVLDPVTISYWAKGKNKEEKITTEALTINVTSFKLAQYSRSWLFSVLVIILLSLFSALIVLTSRKRRRNRDQAHDTTSLKDVINSDLMHCNNCRIKGDWENYIQKAIAIRNQLPTEVKGLEALDKLAERIHYGGFRPTTEEINLIQRQLEQAVKSVFTKDQDKELDGIALR